MYSRSTDSGATWGPEQVMSPVSGTPALIDVECGSGSNVYAAWSRSSQLELRTSTNGGQTWSFVAVDSTSDRPPIVPEDSSTLHLAWSWADSVGGRLYYARSSDKGATWVIDTAVTSLGIAAWPDLAQDRQGYLHLVWSDTRDGNTEVYYKRNPPTGVAESKEPQPDRLSLAVTPTIVTGSARLTFHLPWAGAASATLYDSQGRVVRVLFSGNFEAGVHSQVVRTTALRSGVYFVALETSERRVTAPLVVNNR